VAYKFETDDTGFNPLMGWETSSDMLSELNLEFSTKELAIEYAKKKQNRFWDYRATKKKNC